MSRRKLTGKVVDATSAPETVAVQVQLVFTHEGKPITGGTFEVKMPLPAEPNGMSVIGISLEASEVIGKIAAALEMAKRAAGGILVPSAPKRLPTEILRAGSPAQHRRLD